MGAIYTNHTGSGSAITLSSDGTSLLLNGTPIGGGGSTITIDTKTADYTVVAGDAGKVINCTSGTFTISLTAAATLGSGFNVTIWNTSVTSTDAITIDPANSETIDGVATLVLRRGEGCQIICDGTNWQTGNQKEPRGYAENIYGSSLRPIASASYSTAIGSNSSGSGSQAVTGSGAMALGGSYASGADSFAAAIKNNSSSYGATNVSAVAMGAYSKASGYNSIAFGYSAQSTASNAVCISGDSAIANAVGSVAIGVRPTASGDNSLAIGYRCEASETQSVAIGAYAKSNIKGKYASSSSMFVSGGDSQLGTYVMRRSTSDASPVTLNTESGSGNASNATNQVVLPNYSAYAFSGTIVARQQGSGGTASAAWKVEGLIRREANAAATVLVASTVTAISNAPGWSLALSADTTNGGLAVTATGAAGTNIRWVATIQTSELTYA